MGLFFVDTSEENSLEAKKKYNDEVVQLANEMIEKASKIDDQFYPDFLFEVQLNEFAGDDYRVRGTCTNPNVIKAYSIRRKYSSYWDYLDAMEIYLDYIAYIESVYGDFDMIKNAFDRGYGNIYVPRKPKLTNKKKNKLLLSTNFLPSRIDEDYEININVLDMLISNVKESEINKNYEETKIDKRMIESLLSSRERHDRIGSIYSAGVITHENQRDADAIVALMNSSSIDNFIEDHSNGIEGVGESLEHLHDFDNIPEDILESMFEPSSAYISSAMLINDKDRKQLQILEALETAGYDFLSSSATRGIDRGAIRAITKKYSPKINYDELTPKQIRKLKKKEAKRRRQESIAYQADSRLNRALLSNRVNISREGFLDFKISDVISDLND